MVASHPGENEESMDIGVCGPHEQKRSTHPLHGGCAVGRCRDYSRHQRAPLRLSKRLAISGNAQRSAESIASPLEIRTPA